MSAAPPPRAVESPPGPGGSDRYPWVAMGVVLIGSFMVVLDTSIVNVALPQIGKDFGAVSGVEWVVTAYLLSVGVVQPLTAWTADRLGKKRVFMWSLMAFTVGSLLSALAPDLATLTGFRILQGLGGGAMMPVGMAMIYELFEPHERGTALGIWGIAVMAAPALGPALGGFLSTAATWRLLFLVNVPIGIVGTFAGFRLLRDVGFREHRPFDGPGMALAGIGLTLLLLGLSEAERWGWASPAFLATVVVGTVLLTAFVLRALRVRHPLVDVRMFGVPVFSVTIAIVWLMTVAQFARLVFIPLQLETLRGLSALRVGLVLTPSALGIAITMPIGGRLADRIGARLPVTVGLAIFAASYWPLSRLRLDTPLWFIALVLFVGGLGAGLSMMPNTVTAMNSVPGRYVSQATAVRMLNRQVAGALGVAVLATILATRTGSNHPASAAAAPQALGAYNEVFLISLVLLALAFALGFFLPDREQTLALQEERRREGERDGSRPLPPPE